MLQQIIAVAIILYIIFRLYSQKKKGNIKGGEFMLWSLFWMMVVVLILFIKQIDLLVAKVGFSSSGINVILYLSVAVLFYMYIRLRIKIEKIEKNITKIVQEVSLKE